MTERARKPAKGAMCRLCHAVCFATFAAARVGIFPTFHVAFSLLIPKRKTYPM